ncbi:hypothetical protein ACN47E_006712 [Coniothyrium glycines]
MRATTTFSTLFALATVALANPVNIQLDKRDPNNFRLYVDHWHQNQCAPGACNVGNFDQYSVTVHDDCNGGGCGAQPAAGLAWDGVYCDQDISVCGRTLKLVSRGPDDCKKTTDLSSDNNGQAYATLVEGDKDVGTCAVDFSQSYAKTCGLGGSDEFNSRVLCTFS